MPKLTREQYLNKLKKESRDKPKQEYTYKIYSPPGIHIGYIKATGEHSAIIKAMKKYNLTKKVIAILEEDDERGRSSFDYRGLTNKMLGSNFRI